MRDGLRTIDILCGAVSCNTARFGKCGIDSEFVAGLPGACMFKAVNQPLSSSHLHLRRDLMKRSAAALLTAAALSLQIAPADAGDCGCPSGFKLPKLELPKLCMPKMNLPKLCMPKLDLCSMKPSCAAPAVMCCTAKPSCAAPVAACAPACAPKAPSCAAPAACAPACAPRGPSCAAPASAPCAPGCAAPAAPYEAHAPAAPTEEAPAPAPAPPSPAPPVE